MARSSFFYLPLKGGGRRAKLAGWGSRRSPGMTPPRTASRSDPPLSGEGEWSSRRGASYSPRIEGRLLAGAVALERTLLADRVGALEDPVLPGGQPREDLRFHGLGAGEAQIGFEPG